jgi:hypothetical protein
LFKDARICSRFQLGRNLFGQSFHLILFSTVDYSCSPFLSARPLVGGTCASSLAPFPVVLVPASSFPLFSPGFDLGCQQIQQCLQNLTLFSGSALRVTTTKNQPRRVLSNNSLCMWTGVSPGSSGTPEEYFPALVQQHGSVPKTHLPSPSLECFARLAAYQCRAVNMDPRRFSNAASTFLLVRVTLHPTCQRSSTSWADGSVGLYLVIDGGRGSLLRVSKLFSLAAIRHMPSDSLSSACGAR